MEKLVDSEIHNLLNEIIQGKELANQLQIHLHAPSSSQEVRELLVNKIIDSYDKVLAMVKYEGHLGEKESMPSGAAIATSDSPRSLSGSPRSQDSDTELKDQDRNDASSSRKRKAVPRWTKQVQVYPAAASEGPLDDGCSWRKYGQKEILGAKYPRSYYRCTHRHTQGCLATKQVQRSDDDPTIFEITYRGRHTCNQGTSFRPASTTPPEKQDQNHLQAIGHHETDKPFHEDQCGMERYEQNLLSDFRSNLKVATEGLDTQNHSFPDSFNFPSSPSVNHESFPFSPTLMDHNFATNFPAASVMPPTSSGSNYFLTSPAQINSFDHTLVDFQTSASETTSATNSPTIGVGYPFSSMIFGPNFSFDNPGFSSS